MNAEPSPLTPQLSFMPEGMQDADLATFLSYLATHGWSTREQLCRDLGVSERRVRRLAELAGDQVIRSHELGFKLTDRLTNEEIPIGLHAANSFISQGKHMIRAGLAWKKKLHGRIG